MSETAHLIQFQGQDAVSNNPSIHSQWVHTEAEHLMNDLFDDVEQHLEASLHQASSDRNSYVEATDVDWVDRPASAPAQSLALSFLPDGSTHQKQALAELELDNLGLNPFDLDDPESDSFEPEPATRSWVSTADLGSLSQKVFWTIGTMAVVLPFSFWFGNQLQKATTGKAVIAATPHPTALSASPSDQAFAKYAEQAFKQIQNRSSLDVAASSTGSNGSLSQVLSSVGDRNRLSSFNPSLNPGSSGPSASAGGIPRIALPSIPSQIPLATKDIPNPSLANGSSTLSAPTFAQAPAKAGQGTPSTLSSGVKLPALPTVGATSTLPTLESGISPAPLTIATATPLRSPVQAENKVIGILESGLQSTLMVENNGSYHNFQVGETVNSQGWKLVQITQGKAILQQGQELRTLSEGQYF